MQREYGGFIWTDHAIERMNQRGISQGDAWATLRNPEQTRKGRLHKSSDAWRYYRTYGDQVIEVVARQNERKQWVVISVWSRPAKEYSSRSPHSHTKDRSDKSFMRRLLERIFLK